VGVFVARSVGAQSVKNTAAETERMLNDAREKAEILQREKLIEAKDEITRMREKAEEENTARLDKTREQEKRLNARERSLDKRSDTLDSREHKLSSMQGQVEKRERDLERDQRALDDLKRDYEDRLDEVDERMEQINVRLEQVSGMTADEAKEELLDNLRGEVALESAAIIRESENRTKLEADKKSREILSLAIQRLASEYTTENTVHTVALPSDDLKGRIIGREGRNIRSFEQITGANLIIDDTPECVTISCFDPVRRETARIAMENLIADGRIHPARIEEMFEKATKVETSKQRKAMAYHNMGVIMQRQQQYGPAMEQYKQSLKLRPHDNQTRYNYVLCKKLKKDQDNNQNQNENQNQNKNDKNNKNKDKNKDQNKDKNKDKNDQNKDKDQNKDQNENKERPQDGQMSKENAEQLLNAAVQEEKATQQRLQKAMAKPSRRNIEKNW
jgi:hypothetical protein